MAWNYLFGTVVGLFASSTKEKYSRPRKRSLQIEVLEDRDLLSVSPVTPLALDFLADTTAVVFTPPSLADGTYFDTTNDETSTILKTDLGTLVGALTQDAFVKVAMQTTTGGWLYSEDVEMSYTETYDSATYSGGYTYTFTAWLNGTETGFTFSSTACDTYTITGDSLTITGFATSSVFISSLSSPSIESFSEHYTNSATQITDFKGESGTYYAFESAVSSVGNTLTIATQSNGNVETTLTGYENITLAYSGNGQLTSETDPGELVPTNSTLVLENYVSSAEFSYAGGEAYGTSYEIVSVETPIVANNETTYDLLSLNGMSTTTVVSYQDWSDSSSISYALSSIDESYHFEAGNIGGGNATSNAEWISELDSNGDWMLIDGTSHVFGHDYATLFSVIAFSSEKSEQEAVEGDLIDGRYVVSGTYRFSESESEQYDMVETIGGGEWNLVSGLIMSQYSCATTDSNEVSGDITITSDNETASWYTFDISRTTDQVDICLISEVDGSGEWITEGTRDSSVSSTDTSTITEKQETYQHVVDGMQVEGWYGYSEYDSVDYFFQTKEQFDGEGWGTATGSGWMLTASESGTGWYSSSIVNKKYGTKLNNDGVMNATFLGSLPPGNGETEVIVTGIFTERGFESEASAGSYSEYELVDEEWQAVRGENVLTSTRVVSMEYNLTTDGSGVTITEVGFVKDSYRAVVGYDAGLEHETWGQATIDYIEFASIQVDYEGSNISNTFASNYYAYSAAMVLMSSTDAAENYANKEIYEVTPYVAIISLVNVSTNEVLKINCTEEDKFYIVGKGLVTFEGLDVSDVCVLPGNNEFVVTGVISLGQNSQSASQIFAVELDENDALAAEWKTIYWEAELHTVQEVGRSQSNTTQGTSVTNGSRTEVTLRDFGGMMGIFGNPSGGSGNGNPGDPGDPGGEQPVWTPATQTYRLVDSNDWNITTGLSIYDSILDTNLTGTKNVTGKVRTEFVSEGDGTAWEQYDYTNTESGSVSGEINRADSYAGYGCGVGFSPSTGTSMAVGNGSYSYSNSITESYHTDFIYDDGSSGCGCGDWLITGGYGSAYGARSWDSRTAITRTASDSRTNSEPNGCDFDYWVESEMITVSNGSYSDIWSSESSYINNAWKLTSGTMAGSGRLYDEIAVNETALREWSNSCSGCYSGCDDGDGSWYSFDVSFDSFTLNRSIDEQFAVAQSVVNGNWTLIGRDVTLTETSSSATINTHTGYRNDTLTDACLMNVATSASYIVAYTSTKVFNINGTVSTGWTYERDRASSNCSSQYGYISSSSLSLHETASSSGVASGEYYATTSASNSSSTVTTATREGATISGTRKTYNSSGTLTSTVAINNGNASSYGVGFYGNSDPATQFAPTVYPQEADLPAPPPTPIQQMPVVPKASNYTKPTTALSGQGVTGDDFLDGILQNRRNHLSDKAQENIDTATTIADTAVGMTNVGSAYEAIVGETVSGQALTNEQRAIAGVSVAMAPLTIPFKIIKGGKTGGKVGGEVVEAVLKNADNVIDGTFKGKLPIGEVFPKSAMTQLAEMRGWREVKCQFSHNEKVYYDPKNNVYITRDNTGHNGGSLKIATTPERLGSDKTRMGTYTPDMIRIGK